MALVFIMPLCLLVYNLGQRQLRLALEEQEETVPNQLGKPTQRPIIALDFSMFEGDSLGCTGRLSPNYQSNA